MAKAPASGAGDSEFESRCPDNSFMKKPEILAPIQNYISLRAAIDVGADAVYFGVRGFNMRAGAQNFSLADIAKVVKICHQHKVKAYLALNIIIYQKELKRLERILNKAKQAQVDAVICWDMSVVEMVRKLGIVIHLSTQASVANAAAVKFFAKRGVRRIVLARECSLNDIKKIGKESKVELEVFIHGAMCVSVSGRCFMSNYFYGKSANRGECLQPCRRKYSIKQIDGEKEMELGEDYVLSPKDLCTLPFIEKVIESGVVSLKIEGRNRSPEYVKKVVSIYRRVVDFYCKHRKGGKIEKRYAQEFEYFKRQLMEDLASVYNRGFGNGFYLGKPINEWVHNYGSQATKHKVHLGRVAHYYPKIGVAEIEVQAKQTLRIGDSLIVEGDKTGILEQEVLSMQMGHKNINKAGQGDKVGVKLDKIVKKQDKVYKLKKKN